MLHARKTTALDSIRYLHALLILPALLFAGGGAGAAEETGTKKKDEAAPPPVKTREVKMRFLTLDVPESWKQRESTSDMRLGELEIPAAEGDKEPAELIVYYFGAQGAGTRKANIDRWIGQFEAEGRESKVLAGKAKAGDYSLVDVTGTYQKPVGPPVARKTSPMPGARMLAVILATKDGDVYLKLTGPAKTVARAAADLRRAIGADPAAEKPEGGADGKPGAEKSGETKKAG
jgi:gluconolactonase